MDYENLCSALEAAVSSRDDKISCSRLFHGRGQLTPGLEHIVVDFFPPTLLITIYKETDIQNFHCFKDFPAENILLQKRYLPRPELEILKGEVPSSPSAHESGLSYQLKFGTSQNIGFFLDMKPGRDWLLKNAADKHVLNLFSYTCSLSVAALKGGAELAVNIDMAKGALTVGKENHQLNGIENNKVRFFSYDIMNSWNNIARNGPYDIVVIDPPTNQGDSFKVERDYYKIIKRLGKMTNPEAEIMACLNSPYLTSDFLKNLFSEHAPEFHYVESIPSAFATMEKNPEEGLKILLFRKLSNV
jgi:23S rRNA (cytosine1962-C5)-methyltransferase